MTKRVVDVYFVAATVVHVPLVKPVMSVVAKNHVPMSNALLKTKIVVWQQGCVLIDSDAKLILIAKNLVDRPYVTSRPANVEKRKPAY